MHLRSSRAIALLGLLCAVPAAATVVIAQTFEEMARTSPLIIRASIGQTQSAWAVGERTIETWVEVQVTEVYKGKLKAGSTLMVRNPGGVVGAMGARVAGAARFTPGEDTLLFLEPAADAPNVWLVTSLAAGKITFAKNAFGEVRAVRDLRGISFYERNAGAPKYREVHAPEDLGTPDELIARIKRAVKR
jgi:hypothetical protein